AVRTEDFHGSGPWTFKVEGRRAAGDEPSHVEPGRATALRIFTGAAVPDGFDAVVMQERCVRSGDHVTFSARPASGHNIRFSGEDIASGANLLAEGALLTP